MAVSKNFEAFDSYPKIKICRNCDLLQKVPKLKPGFNAKCKRCGTFLTSKKSGAINKALALSASSLILFLPAVSYPLIELKLMGETKSGSILSAGAELLNSGYFFISALVLIFAVVIPFIKFFTLCYTLSGIFAGKKLPFSFLFFKTYCRIKSLSMEEVFLMAILTALTKLDSISGYSIKPGFYFFTALIAVSVTAQSFITDSEIWERLETI
jgi:paraquat-inducible protein A